MQQQTIFPNAQTVPFSIPAGGNIDILVAGNTIAVVETTAAFKASPNNATASMELDKGLSYTCPDGVDFDFVTLRNETGVAITGKVFVGRGTIVDGRLIITSGATINVQPVAGQTFQFKSNVTSGSGAVTAVPAGVSTLVAISNALISGFFLQNTGAVNVYYGSSNNVGTLTNQGIILGPMEISPMIEGNFAVYATALSGTGEIRRLERRGS